MLLTEYRTFKVDKRIIERSIKENKNLMVSGVIQRADAKNQNSRRYPKPILEREIENNIKGPISENRAMGELDHPTHDAVKLGNVSHLVTKLTMKGNDMLGEAEILNTPCGQVAQALIKGGVKLGISSRGMGSVTERGGYALVNDDFKLVTFDLVADPSTKGAFPGLVNESKEFIEETIRTTYDKALNEKIFIRMLENKLNKK